MGLNKRKTIPPFFTDDLIGGTTAMLVALPSAIAFGIIIFAPLGSEFSGQAAISGILGSIILSITAAFFGGTRGLITAPCAPATAFLSIYVSQLVRDGHIDRVAIPALVALVGLGAGLVQLLLGLVGGGKIIKYIPYPVVAGFLSASGLLILIGQIPKLLGVPNGISLFRVNDPSYHVDPESMMVGGATLVAMFVATRFIKRVPLVVTALAAGLLTYAILAIFDPSLRVLNHNPLVVGQLSQVRGDMARSISDNLGKVFSLGRKDIISLLFPAGTLAALLSIDTLKTCLIVDTFTHQRHDSNKELLGQGLANIASSAFFGIPGAGTTGPTLINIRAGARTRLSGVIMGLASLMAFFFLGGLIAWTPIPALAAVLIHTGIRMVDFKSIYLLKSRSTRLDFLVMLSVVLSAMFLDLMTASVIGIGLAIIMFMRDQMKVSVIRRTIRGDQTFSKQLRSISDMAILEASGRKTIIMELQGHLFFGTTDQLYNNLEPYLSDSRFLVLDMRRIHSLDFTATQMLKQIHSRLKSNGGNLIISNLHVERNILEHMHATRPDEFTGLLFFQDLNAALEHLEDVVLSDARTQVMEDHEGLELHDFEIFEGMPDDVLAAFSSCLAERICEAGEVLFREKDKGDIIFFVRKGAVHVNLHLSGDKHLRLLTIGKEGMFGEMAFIDKQSRSSDAVIVKPTQLYVLSREIFEMISMEHPAIAAWFYERMASLISARLRITNSELKVLKEH
jgi:sulfate permease, SulP family